MGRRHEDVARRREVERQRAARAEEEAEMFAPRAQRHEVMRRWVEAGTGIVRTEMVRDALVEVDERRGGYRRVDPLLRLHHRSPRVIAWEHVRAAQRFALDWERGLCGGLVPMPLGERVGRGIGACPSEVRLAAATAYREACDVLGVRRQVVQWVVLERWTLEMVRRVMGGRDAWVRDSLRDGLEVLVDHYGLRPRSVVSEEGEGAIDSSVTDIPQVRLGRARSGREKGAR